MLRDVLLRYLVGTAPFWPASVFLVLGLLRKLHVPMTERLVGRAALTAIGLSVAASLYAFVCAFFFPNAQHAWVIHYGQWFRVGDYGFRVGLFVDRLSAAMALLTTVVTWIMAKFAVTYLHKEEGYARFFLLTSLFTSGMMLLVLGDSYETLFFGWEIVGICSALLIAFFRERTQPVQAALRAFATYRFTDAGLLVATLIMHSEGLSTEFADLIFGGHAEGHGGPEHVSTLGAALIGLALLFAASGKSALFPLGNWLPRAMEGPTPSSALFYGAISVHGGVYLLLRSAPVLELSPIAKTGLVIVGVLTAIQGEVVGRVQTDVKSRLAYAAMGQIGIMVALIGLGFYGFAFFLLCAHAVLRGYQLLRAPSALRDAQDTGRLYEWPSTAEANQISPRLYAFAIARFHLDEVLERFLVWPLTWLALRLDRLEQLLLPTGSAIETRVVAEAEDHEAHALVTDAVTNGGARSRARAVAANPLARFLLLSGAFAVLSVIVLVVGSR